MITRSSFLKSVLAAIAAPFAATANGFVSIPVSHVGRTSRRISEWIPTMESGKNMNGITYSDDAILQISQLSIGAYVYQNPQEKEEVPLSALVGIVRDARLTDGKPSRKQLDFRVEWFTRAQFPSGKFLTFCATGEEWHATQDHDAIWRPSIHVDSVKDVYFCLADSSSFICARPMECA